MAPPTSVLAYRAGTAAARAVPRPIVHGVAWVGGEVAGQLARRGPAPSGSHGAPAGTSKRDLVARHLRRAMGDWLSDHDLSRAVNAAFASYARYWAESLRLPGTPPAVVDAGMSWEGIGRITKAVHEGRGAILALPHLGGWEWGGFWMAQRGFVMTVVVEALEPPELFDWFARFRRSLGMNVVAVGPAAAAAVVRALRAGGVVCLLCDRTIGNSAGVEVEFFGERTSLPGGPATLAMRSGAALLPCAVYFDGAGEHHRAVVRPEIVTRGAEVGRSAGGRREETTRVTQVLARELEVLIRRAPTQWHLMQPNWPSDPGYRR